MKYAFAAAVGRRKVPARLAAKNHPAGAECPETENDQ
tara:strand:- start:370 stop:480 length:111 start_codon:yes stop_codon:yes gene_type:complete